MGGLAIVAPMGRCCKFSKLTCCRSAICRCCIPSQLCLRVPFSKIRVSKVCSRESFEERWLSSIRRRVLHLWEDGKQGTKRSFNEESLRRLVAGIVLSVYARAFEAARRKEGMSSETDGRRACFAGRSGEALPLGEESCGFRCRGGHDGGSFSFWGRSKCVLEPSTDEYTWQGPKWREMARIGGGRGFHPSDERLGGFLRFADSWTMKSPSQDGEGSFEDRVQVVGSRVLERQDGWGNEKAKNYISRHSSSNIPRSELLKIEELRFSGDMQEGDSSPQVLNLQRALFWLGHLPGLSLTGYFGPETTKAVQEFHASNGFFSGVWSFHSQQLLWKFLYPETHKCHPKKGEQEKSRREPKELIDFGLLKSWRLVKNASEFVSSVSSTLPCSTVMSQRVGVLLLMIAVLSIVFRVVEFCLGRVYGQPVRKRTMSWRNGVDLRRSRKAIQSPFNAELGLHESSDSGEVLPYFQNHRHPKTTSKEDSTGCNLLDCLVLFDGQVVHGDCPTNRKLLRGSRSQVVHMNENNMENASDSALEGKSSPVVSHKQFHQLGSSIEAKKLSHGICQSQKLEGDPANRMSSAVQSEKSSRSNGGNHLLPCSSLNHGWASWIRFFFAPFFPNSESPPHDYRTAASRRSVVRTTSSRRTVSHGRGVPGDLESHLKSSNFDKGLPTERETHRQEEEIELDWKKRVEELHKTVQSVEQTRDAAMRALAEEKMQNLELEVKIRCQREAAAALKEEVRMLQDSHEALLVSLKKKYSSPAAARAAAALLYQNWGPSDRGARV